MERDRMTVKTAVDNLVVNYGKYGYTRQNFIDLLKSGIDKGFSVRSAYNGIKMIFALQSGEHEYFSTDEVAEMLGVSPEEALEEVERQRAELIRQGKNPDDYFTPITPQNSFKMIFPDGLNGSGQQA